MRTCIVHIGTHKTGTTSLQLFFQENFHEFARAGMHVAQAGRYLMRDASGATAATPGHHDLAWDLVADGENVLRAVLDELRAVPSRSALLSSEDFSLLYARPAMLEILRDRMLAAGFGVKIVVYLRAQAAYAESMYVERLKHAHVRPLAVYLDRILEEGRYLPPGTRQDIAFEYGRLLEPFVRVFGAENVAVRAYAPQNTTEIFADFLTVLQHFDPELAAAQPKLKVAHPRQNESLSFAGVLATLHAEAQRSSLAGAAEFIRSRAEELSAAIAGSRFALLSRDEHLALLHRFGDDNRRIAQAFGAAIPFRTEADVAPASDPRWEKAAAERAVLDRCVAWWNDPASGPLDGITNDLSGRESK